MKPDVTVVLETTATRLMFELAPQLQPAFLQGTITVVGLLLSMLREEWDRVAERRVEENRALRQIFRNAAPHIEEPELQRRLLTAAKEVDASVRISDLDQSNDSLRRLLIDLQTHVEDQSSAAARTIEAEIWQELLASTERRRFMIAPF